MSATTSDAAAPSSAIHAVRPYYWSVRRELWEHRSLYIAPLAAAGVVLFGFLISATHLPHFRSAFSSLTAEKRAELAHIPYFIAAVAIMGTGLIVGSLYCLGALHNERRDRTILFWKSLPVSDLITVASKATIPLLVLPAVVFVVIVALQLVMLVINVGVFAANRLGATTAPLFLPQIALLVGYSLVVMALWYAPITAWLLLVSAWARRTPFLWALLPPLALVVLERIAFDTDVLHRLLTYRLNLPPQAFVMPAGMHGLPQANPLGFLSTVDLWTGLAIAIALLAAAVWVRRYREPI